MTRRHWIGAVVLAALLVPWLVDVLVVTDEEAIRGLLEDFTENTESRDLEAMFALLSEDFVSEAPGVRERTPAEWRSRAERFFEPVLEVRADLDQVEVQVEGDQAHTAVKGFLMLRRAEGGLPWQVQADLTWRRGAAGWSVVRLTRLETRLGAF